MGEFSSVDALATTIAHDAQSGANIFGVDGHDGSGKSTLAAALGSNLGWPVISLDAFLHKNQEEYVSHLNYEALGQAIFSASRPMIIEGVCLLDVAERLHLKLDRHIYVKRLSPAGIWSDEDECDFDGPIEHVLAKIEEDIKVMDDFIARTEGNTSASANEDEALPPFRAEVIRYHARRKPTRVAHHLFARREADA